MTEPNEMTAWTILAAPGELKAASYLSGPLAKQYRLIVDTLADQQDISLTGVGYDELELLVKNRLPSEAADDLMDNLVLADRLKQLVTWGTCESWQDKAESEQEFLRNRYRYQLTESGSAINRAARQVEADLGPTSTAILLAPKFLTERLAAALDAVDDDRPEDASSEFAQVEQTLDHMARAATDWQSKLAAALGGAPTEARVTRLLETILAYVDVWGSGVDAHSQRLSAAIPRLRAIPDDMWRALTLVRLGSEANAATLADAQRHLSTIPDTVARWFAGPFPQATRLRRQMRDAVTPVLRAHRALLAVGGTVSRSAELLRLADAITVAGSDDEAWRIFATASGLFSARHLTMRAPEEPNSVSTWDAAPVPVSKRLRAQGRRSLSGKAPRVPDNSEARRLARQEAARNRADLAAAEHRLTARTGTALSQWEPLSQAEADLFLTLLSAAREHGSTGVTADGRWTMTLTPTDPPTSAVVRTASGRIVLADAVVEFTS